MATESKSKRTVAISLTALFVGLAVFHLIGAFGVWRSLSVIPEIPGRVVTHPPPASWLAVTACLVAAAVVVLTRGDIILRRIPRWLSTTACLGLAAVFMLRTVGNFRTFGFFKKIEDTPFALYDTWLYTPLCLAIGLATLWLSCTHRDVVT